MVSFIKNIFKETLHKVCLNGDIEAIKQHLADGVDVNVKDDGGTTPLHEVAEMGYKEIAELLIANGADVNAKDSNEAWTPLFESLHPLKCS